MLQLCMDCAIEKLFEGCVYFAMDKVHLNIKSGRFVERCFFFLFTDWLFIYFPFFWLNLLSLFCEDRISGAFPAYFSFLAVEAFLGCLLVGCMSKSAVVLNKTIRF